jgi:hypothetical protein
MSPTGAHRAPAPCTSTVSPSTTPLPYTLRSAPTSASPAAGRAACPAASPCTFNRTRSALAASCTAPRTAPATVQQFTHARRALAAAVAAPSSPAAAQRPRAAAGAAAPVSTNRGAEASAASAGAVRSSPRKRRAIQRWADESLQMAAAGVDGYKRRRITRLAHSPRHPPSPQPTTASSTPIHRSTATSPAHPSPNYMSPNAPHTATLTDAASSTRPTSPVLPTSGGGASRQPWTIEIFKKQLLLKSTSIRPPRLPSTKAHAPAIWSRLKSASCPIFIVGAKKMATRPRLTRI